MGQDGGFIVVTLGQCRRETTSGKHFRAARQSAFHLVDDLLPFLRPDHRRDFALRIGSRPEDKIARQFQNLLQESRIDFLLHIHPLDRGANLTGVEKASPDGGVGGGLEV